MPTCQVLAGSEPLCPQVDIVSRSGEQVPVSVWMQRVKQEHSLCCVVVLEPVERVSAWVAFQSNVSLFLSCVSPPHRGLRAERGHGVLGGWPPVAP